MNYIQQLQESVKEKEKGIDEVIKDMNHFISFLQSSKFQGIDTDGTKKDWIRTGEVIERLRGMRSQLEYTKTPEKQ